MIDIELARKHPVVVRNSLKKRNNSVLLSDFEKLLKLDSDWRKLKQENDVLRRGRNELTEKINIAKREKKNLAPLLAQAKKIPEKIKENEAKIQKLSSSIKSLLLVLPNILDPSVPIGKTEKDNVVVRQWGNARKPSFVLRHHGELAVSLGLADFERAVKISGSGFYFLKNELVLLDLALQKLAMDFLSKKGFSLVSVPLLLARKPYEGVTSLDDFESMMYRVESSDQYLIATSEHPIAAMYLDEILPEEALPIKLCGISPCFRKEIGKHGLDERGLFRVHQFNKVEQFVFCSPDQSNKIHEELLSNSEWLLQQLEIPYRVVNVCSGEIGNIAAKKYDVEGFSPRENKYIELMSCSNCTDYQANSMSIRYRKKGSIDKAPVHTLNNTMIATARTMRLILEHYQTPEGTLKIPKALHPYMNGVKEIKPKK